MLCWKTYAPSFFLSLFSSFYRFQNYVENFLLIIPSYLPLPSPLGPSNRLTPRHRLPLHRFCRTCAVVRVCPRHLRTHGSMLSLSLSFSFSVSVSFSVSLSTSLSRSFSLILYHFLSFSLSLQSHPSTSHIPHSLIHTLNLSHSHSLSL